MSPSAPVIVHPSCVQTASMAVKPLALVRASRNTPATDCTSAASPTPPNADVPTVTRTPLLLNWPSTTASSVAAVLGAVGEDEDEPPLQAVNSVASAAP